VRLGTAIMQMSARQPAAAAMAAMTMDHLSGGRFVLGIGVSGPQVVEGWYGMPFEKPLARTREYVKIVRDIVARNGRVTNDGPHYPLPYPNGTGLGKPLRSTIHPVREDIPIFLGAEGPKNVSLAAEICDGWMALFFSPRNQDFYRDALEEGFARDAARSSWDDFEVMATVPVIIHDDVEQAADYLRPMYALYFGGMGARGRNFHHDVAVRLGYEAEAKRVQDLYLDGKKDEAAAALPAELIDRVSLCGPKERVAERLEVYRDAGVGTLVCSPMSFDVEGRTRMIRELAEIAA
jgi:F420-dependent oxidoreductase-like protein